jgi:hypothetical protein
VAGRDNSATNSLLPSSRRIQQYGSSQPTPLHSLSGAIDVVLTEESHSELGAARDVLRHVWIDLQSGQIQLSSGNSQPSQSQTGSLRKIMGAFWGRVKRISKLFLHNITDIAFSLLMSVIFVGIFVAESTSGILSANIVSDSVALLDSSGCGIYTINGQFQQFRRDFTALEYRDQCYKKDALTEGCDYFYISTLPFTEIHKDNCPFEGQACLGDAVAYTLDTGLLDASSLGINTAKKLQFRRRTTCTPLRTGSWIDPTENCTAPRDWPPRGIMMDGLVFPPFEQIVGQLQVLIAPGGSFTWGHRSSIRPGSLYPDLRSLGPGVFLMWISVRCARYFQPRNDPIFPASELQTINGGTYWISNVTRTTLACVDNAQICDPISKLCQDADLSFYGKMPDIWSSESFVTELERILALLSYALYFSSMAEAARLANLVADPRSSTHMAKEQWKAEARRWFEISLARMQVEVLELAQFSREKLTYKPSDYVSIIPPRYRGICNMVKFRSNGWRNVSVWGFFGVLFLVIGISLGSIKNREETLWLVIAIRSFFHVLWWLWKSARRISWRSTLAGAKDVVIRQ